MFGRTAPKPSPRPTPGTPAHKPAGTTTHNAMPVSDALAPMAHANPPQQPPRQPRAVQPGITLSTQPPAVLVPTHAQDETLAGPRLAASALAPVQLPSTQGGTYAGLLGYTNNAGVPIPAGTYYTPFGLAAGPAPITQWFGGTVTPQQGAQLQQMTPLQALAAYQAMQAAPPSPPPAYVPPPRPFAPRAR